MTAINEDNLFAVIIRGSQVLLAVLTFAGGILFSLKVSMGILVGGTIAIINFLWFVT